MIKNSNFENLATFDNRKFLIVSVIIFVLFCVCSNKVFAAVEFDPAVEYPAGAAPEDMSEGDLDGDNDIDIVIANGNGSVSVMMNNGFGNYYLYSSLNSGISTRSVVMSDLDNDGDLDIVAGDVTGWRIYVYKNDGNGNFISAGILNTLTTSPRALVASDFDGDGDVDLASSNVLYSVSSSPVSDRSIGIYLNDGNGNLTDIVNKISLLPVPRTSLSRSDIESGDFDSDGDIDLAVSSEDIDSVSILFNDGNAVFSRSGEKVVGDRPSSITSGDFDSDGDIDLVVSNLLFSISVLQNNGNGGFADSINFSSPTSLTAITKSDIDNDGDIDLISGGSDGSGIRRVNVSLFTNDGFANFVFDSEMAIGGQTIYSVKAVDLDSDTDADIVTVNRSTNDMSILIQQISNNSPVFNLIGNQTTSEGQPLQFIVSATDPDNHTLTYTATNLPQGATLNSATGEFSWTPDYDDAGVYNVTFTVSDNGDPVLSDSKTITITVQNTNRTPVLAPIGNQTVSEGTQLVLTLSAADPDDDTLTYIAANLPTGASFNQSTHTFSWTPGYSDAGNYTDIEFTVSDSGTPMELAVELITITVGNINRAPVFMNPGPQEVLEDELLTFTVSASDPDSDSVTITSTNMPSGASFDGTTFNWTPTRAQEGIYTISLTATDNDTTVESSLLEMVITVGDNPTPTEQAENLVDVVVTLDIPQNVENSYLANLQKVAQFINDGKIQAALNQLQAFINKVNQDYQHGILSIQERDALLNMAQNLVDGLSN